MLTLKKISGILAVNFIGKLSTITAHIVAALILDTKTIGIIHHINSFVSISGFLNFSGVMDLAFQKERTLSIGSIARIAFLGNTVGFMALAIGAYLLIPEAGLLAATILGLAQLVFHSLYAKGQYLAKKQQKFGYVSSVLLAQSISYSLSYVTFSAAGFNIYSMVSAGLVQVIVGVTLFNLGVKKTLAQELGSGSKENISPEVRPGQIALHMLYIGSNIMLFQTPILITGFFIPLDKLGVFSFSLLAASQAFLLLSYLSRNVLLPYHHRAESSSPDIEKKISIIVYLGTATASLVMFSGIPYVMPPQWKEVSVLFPILAIGISLMTAKIFREAELMARGEVAKNAILSVLSNAVLAVCSLVACYFTRDLISFSAIISFGYVLLAMLYRTRLRSCNV